jgi:hypothetical protein
VKNVNVFKNTPKINENNIIKAANRELLLERLMFVFIMLVLQITPFGFGLLFPKDWGVDCWISLIGVIFGFFVLVFGTYLLISGSADLSEIRYINREQEEELMNLSKNNSDIGKYLFLLRRSGRPAYIVEYKQLKTKLSTKCRSPYMVGGETTDYSFFDESKCYIV